jgi:hypothetical protein
MTDINTPDKITVTLKADGSAPWIVIHAASREEADSLLSAVYSGEQNLAEHAAAASAVVTLSWSEEKKRHQEGAAVQTVQNAVSQQPPSGVYVPAQPTGGGIPNAPTCVHGEMVARSGNTNGRAWSGWFCPTPKNTPGQCAPQFNK